jgi:iron(III) transport system permease protein
MLLFLQNRYLSKRSYTVVSGRGFRVRHYSLGRWSPLVLAFCMLYLLIAVILPLLVLIKNSFQVYPTPYFRAFTLANWTAFIHNEEVVGALVRSFYLSIFGATLTVLFTAVVAYVIHRSRMPGRGLLEYVTSIPVGTPGIVMGLGIMWAYITWPLWGTVWILVLAYMTLFMPYGVRALGAAFVQIHAELEESSRVHRASWFMTFRRVVLPLPLRYFLHLDPAVHHLHPRDQYRGAPELGEHPGLSRSHFPGMDRRQFQRHECRRAPPERHHPRRRGAVPLDFQGRCGARLSLTRAPARRVLPGCGECC